jgi:hypothetical protein
MKTYTVTKQGYQALRTFDKVEAETKLNELLKYSPDWYICEQGKDDTVIDCSCPVCGDIHTKEKEQSKD